MSATANAFCRHCGTRETPQWRSGPNGSSELCNACGIRYKSGRLFRSTGRLQLPTSIDSSKLFQQAQHYNDN
ncbi:hypothetical protein C4D60_Mb11t09860 [Musa balbisiana]|uniref:GATA-type domain-containing protein n=1 Tax=Musa balbisiana TaxID=52838 RepID=A0A4S8J329_MUSBA|nr:hypothetical protein C4D60_Mb11t09860 [Musa balbisiana]